jgi:SAM-dependent MidA family methyltransferase
VNPLEERLRDEIRRRGPMSFRQFMEAALYDREYGYYRRGRDPFGRQGDFYTAEQVQPVFGRLVAARVRQLYREMGSPADFTVVELGAGRREMAPAFAEWLYIPVESAGEIAAAAALPKRFRGVCFSNEFFDALPVEVVRTSGAGIRQWLVGWEGERLVWTEGGAASEEVEEYARRYLPPDFEGIAEVNLEALDWLQRIAGRLEAGYILTIDYGYTRTEAARFPRGTLMSYRRHTALENVLQDPGEQDITAHVCFTALVDRGARLGLQNVGFETLAQMLLTAGQADQFDSALAGQTPAEEFRN